MHTKQQAGFTLVELAVVVFLVGLMASLGLSALNAQLVSASISTTKKKQETIKDALIFYLGKNKRLPCPSTNRNPPDGIESRANSLPANCTGYFGIIPYAELGLPRSAALDGWENFFSYAVTRQWTATYDSTATPANGANKTNDAAISFNVGNLGAITVKDRSPATNDTPTTIPIKAAVLVVSHGKNGLGAFTSKGTQNVSPANEADELFNVPVATTWPVPISFYQREYTDVDVPTYGAFDDVVQVLNPNDLITPLMKDGALKSAESQWSDQVTNIKSAVIGYMFSPSNNGSCAPPDSTTFTGLLTTNNIPSADPWGGLITYAQKICELKKDGEIKQAMGPISAPCSSSSNITDFSIVAYTITTSTNDTVNGPRINQLMANYPNLLQNCP